MNKYLTYISLLFLINPVFGQSGQLKGTLIDESSSPILFANVVLYKSSDSSIVKIETTDKEGSFLILNIPSDEYFLKASYVGFQELIIDKVLIGNGEFKSMGILIMNSATIELGETIITAKRALVEVKTDRTIFNVQGTINSAGSNGIELLRKAPGVTVDNNDNVSVLGRSGVILYVDGKRVPLSGQELSTYLESLTSDQIDRINIISNPGAKYEAEGNAGIIDIVLKKDKNLGGNGSVNSSYRQGRYGTFNMSTNGNYRTKNFNIFGSVGVGVAARYNETDFLSYQNGIILTETNDSKADFRGWDYRIGTDFFLSENHTIGFIFTGRRPNGTRTNDNRIVIAEQMTMIVDSILVAQNIADFDQKQETYNVNYRYVGNSNSSLNIDFDYGRYINDVKRYQPNQYFNSEESVLLTSVINSFETPNDIGIYTFKIDYDIDLYGGKLGAGSKLSRVVSKNTFKQFDVINDVNILNDRKSNQFDYTENVYAGYLNYSRNINDKWAFSAGIRAELTDANGDLMPFDISLSEPPVELNYLSWFPSAGLTFMANENNSFSLNFGRRINRPDYNVLNPFNIQISEISFERGNPFLNPEIVNNFELGYTYSSMYNLKIAYSKTSDQITSLILPDKEDVRANSISWANLANQTVWSASLSAPIDITEKWNIYSNISASHIYNQADYGEDAVVDLKAFSYNIYQQHSITLPKGFRGEVSGYFAGPGVWGGVFEYETSWSLGLGVQKKFLNDQLNVRLSVDDIFYQSGWNGFSDFNGLYSIGAGNYDSRRGAISISYNFGNQNVKSRNRKTGIESEAQRVSNG